MGKIIAVAGKGGVGKTTIAGLVIKYLKNCNSTPILAVDADPSTNLNITLGIRLTETVGGIRERARFDRGSQSLPDYLDLRINMALVEGEGIDLIAMGRVEGKGCYCSANANLRQILKKLTANYRYIVIDNEAGLEHISRQTDDKVDVMLIVSDISPKGIITAIKIKELIKELENEISKTFLIINKAKDELSVAITKLIDEHKFILAGKVREDAYITALEHSDTSILDLKDDTPSFADISSVLEKINI